MFTSHRLIGLSSTRRDRGTGNQDQEAAKRRDARPRVTGSSIRCDPCPDADACAARAPPAHAKTRTSVSVLGSTETEMAHLQKTGVLRW